MFSFFIRKPQIVLDCFTSNHDAFHLTPIVEGIKTYPDWWKQLPVIDSTSYHYNDGNYNEGSYLENGKDKNDNTLNMKRCYGFTELFRRSAVIESWSDINIRIIKDNIYPSCSNGPLPEQHPSHQYGNAFTNYNHIKFKSPWRFKEKTGVNFLLICAEWHLDEYNLKMPPGCLDFRTQHYININTFLPKQDTTNISIKSGAPLAYLIPLSESKLKINNHFVDELELEKLSSVNRSFYGYRHHINLIERNEKRSKCPFHFG